MNTQGSELTEYDQLLEWFAELSGSTGRDQTVLEIAGYPHYENVCSNILAFYFDPGREHNLGTLLLESLLDETFPEYVSEALVVDDVRREDSTDAGNRLDIVIESAGAVIGIENKVDASLYNDLSDYHDHLSTLADGTRNVYPVVLSVWEVGDAQLHGFVTITYENFFRAVQQKIGAFLQSGRGRYLEFLLEFIETMLEMTRRPTVDRELWTFFEEREDKVMSLYREVRGFQKELRGMVQRLADRVELPEDLPEGIVKKWFWREQGRLLDDCVIDIRMDEDLMIALDTNIEPTGWSTTVWARRGSVSQLDEHLDAIQLRREPHPNHRNRFLVAGSEFAVDTPVDLVAERLQPIVDSLINRATPPIPR